MEDKLWWLSFCDTDRPSGQQFLGVCIVAGRDLEAAVRNAWVLGINPGGQVLGLKASKKKMRTFLAEEHWGKLLNRAELALACQEPLKTIAELQRGET